MNQRKSKETKSQLKTKSSDLPKNPFYDYSLDPVAKERKTKKKPKSQFSQRQIRSVSVYKHTPTAERNQIDDLPIFE